MPDKPLPEGKLITPLTFTHGRNGIACRILQKGCLQLPTREWSNGRTKSDNNFDPVCMARDKQTNN